MRRPFKGHGMSCLWLLLPKPKKGNDWWCEIHRNGRCHFKQSGHKHLVFGDLCITWCKWRPPAGMTPLQSCKMFVGYVSQVRPPPPLNTCGRDLLYYETPYFDEPMATVCNMSLVENRETGPVWRNPKLPNDIDVFHDGGQSEDRQRPTQVECPFVTGSWHVGHVGCWW